MKKDDTGYENEPDITSKKLVRPFTVLPAAKRERSWDKMREREAQEELEFRTTMLQMSQSIGGIFSLLKAPPINDVLASMSGVIGADGNGKAFFTRTFSQSFSSVFFENISASELVVAAGPPSPDGNAPGRSQGVFWVPAGYYRVVPLRGTAFTIYGPIGSNFDITVYARPQTPSAGACGQG